MHYHQEKEYLPRSNQAYWVKQSGEVWSEEGKVEIRRNGNNELVVHLSWYDGCRDYAYSAVIGVTYFKVAIPNDLLERVELIFLDGDDNNRQFSNLAYRFKDGPLESKEFKGFYYVPYYTNYVIDRDGNAVPLKLFRKTGIFRFKKWCVSNPKVKKNIKGGYYGGRGVRDHDGVTGASRHRFVALTFIPYNDNPAALTVNHKNGTPGDDRISNLEWTTYSENTKHAYSSGLYMNKVSPVLYRNDMLGIETRYPTVVACSTDLGVSDGFITARISKPHVLYTDGRRFKYDDGKDWVETTIERTPSVEMPVVAKDVFTGNFVIYANSEKASEATGIGSATIKYHCKSKTPAPIKSYAFRYAGDNSWPLSSDLHLRMYRRFPEGPVAKGILLLDDNNKLVNFYECSADFQKVSGITEGSVRKMIQRGKKWNGFTLKKFDIRGTL